MTRLITRDAWSAGSWPAASRSLYARGTVFLLEGSMESAELDPEDDSIDLTDELSNVPSHRRMAVGTIAPPIGDSLDNLRSQAERYRSAQDWHELSRTLRRIIDVGQL